MQRLQGAGLVSSKMGPAGGFTLKKKSSAISLLDIMEAVQPPLTLSRCLSTEGLCVLKKKCPISNRLKKLQKQMMDYLSDITLEELVRECRY
jgi:Rrf2 family protein